MRRCLHVVLLSIESAILAWLAASLCLMQFPDGFIRHGRAWHLDFAFKNLADRAEVANVQVFYKTRSNLKWIANERYGKPIFMSNAPTILSFELPRTATAIRIDFHIRQDVLLPEKVPVLDKIEIAGGGMTCSALKEFFSKEHHTVGYEGRLPTTLMYFMLEFWLVFGIFLTIIGGVILFVIAQNHSPDPHL